MYLKFFELTEKPFSHTPDPTFLYLNDSYREAIASLRYGIEERKGFIALIGEAGTGKTTLLRKLVDDLGPAVVSVFLFNPNATFDEILEFTLSELGIPAPSGRRLNLLQRLNEFLLAAFAEGRNTILLIDEAQDLDSDVLESLRLLSNLETAKEKILQIVLSGQPELAAKLAQPRLRQLKQRISVRCRLEPLQREELPKYVAARLAIAGRTEPLFLPDTFDSIWEFSNGIPRLVNTVCDNALLVAYALGKPTIDAGVLREVASDLRRLDQIDDTGDDFFASPPRAGRRATVQRTEQDTATAAPEQPSRPNASTTESNEARPTPPGRVSALSESSGDFAAGFTSMPPDESPPQPPEPISATAPHAPRPSSRLPSARGGAAGPAPGGLPATMPSKPDASRRPSPATHIGEERLNLVVPEVAEPAPIMPEGAPPRPQGRTILLTAAGIGVLAAVGVLIESGWLSFGPRQPIVPEALPTAQQEARAPQGAGDPAPRDVARAAAEAVAAAPSPTAMPSGDRNAASGESPPEPAASAEEFAARAELPEQPPAGRRIRVRVGDTLLNLAEREYGRATYTTLDLLRVANPTILDVNKIVPGTELSFPDPGYRSRVIPQGARFAVLALATPTRARALEVQRKLQAKYRRPVLVETLSLSDGLVLYRVFVEDYETYSEAEPIAGALGGILVDPAL